MSINTFLKWVAITLFVILLALLTYPYHWETASVAAFPQTDAEKEVAKVLSWAEEEYGHKIHRVNFIRNQSVTTTNIAIRTGVRTKAVINIGTMPDIEWFRVSTLNVVYSDVEGKLSNLSYTQALQWVALHEYGHLRLYHTNLTGFFNDSLITQATQVDYLDYRRRYNEAYADNFATISLNHYLQQS